MRLRPLRKTTLWLVVAAATASCGSVNASSGAAEQMSFGVAMAKRGLWNEAVFRFRQVERLRPGDVRALNNLAVAYEAIGRFEQALETYQKALAINPGNSELKKNYARFIEFYQSFRPPEEKQEEAGPADEGSATGEGEGG